MCPNRIALAPCRYCGGVEGGVPGGPGGRFGAAVAADLDADRFRGFESRLLGPVGHVGGAFGGVVLEAVVDGDESGAQAHAGGAEREGVGERERVGPAGAGGEHE